MSFPQQDRLLRIYGAPFSGDDVLLTSLSGSEAMSRLYNLQLDFASTRLDLKAPDLVGKPFKVEVAHTGEDEKKPPRFVNGYISRVMAGDVSGEDDAKTKFREYRAELVPWLWFLTQTARCFIYFPEKEEKSIFEIIEAVFDRAKKELHIDPKVDLSGINELKNCKVLHCVQYRETDFNFVSRIMEQYGAYYYFTQQDGEHTLVVNMTTKYPKNAQAEIPFPHQTAGGRSKGDHINGWQHAYEFVSGKWTHTDYNFESSSAKMFANSPKITASHPDAAKYEVYDYPGEYGVKGDGDTLARVRQEEEEVPHDTVHGSSGCRTMMSGHTFSLKNHPDGKSVSEKGSYLITSVHHHASQPGPETGGESTEDYSNTFTCVPDRIQFRPARITPKPVVSGIQSAVVVGPQDEEIHTDEFGRIKVAFHWDRQDVDREQKNRKKVENGEKFYCWVRVAQNIAGNKWGFMAIPRIGQEVVVDFLEGDPDQPLVVGSVYNEGQMPHYPLPDEKAKSYIKTNSTKGGEGFNELMFDDTEGEERLYLHAEKDQDVVVKNDSREHVYGDRHRIIGSPEDDEKGNVAELMHGAVVRKVMKHQLETISDGRYVYVGGGQQDDAGVCNYIFEVQERKIVGEQGKHLIVRGDCNNEIGGGLSVAVGGQHQETCGGFALDAGAGDVYVKGTNVVIEGTAQLTIKVGGSFVSVSGAGVDIVGPMVNINSGGSAGSGSPPQPAAPEEAQEPGDRPPDEAWDSKTGHKSNKG
jgi:type VI secretion system secreted protein VgrG